MRNDGGDMLFGAPVEYIEFDPQGMTIEIPTGAAGDNGSDGTDTNGSLGVRGKRVGVRLRGTDRSDLHQQCGGGRRVIKKRISGGG